MNLEKAYDCAPWGVLWGVQREYGVQGLSLRAIWSLYSLSESCVCILGTKSNMFSVGVGLLDCPLSQILFVIFMDRISRPSRWEESVWFGDLRIASLLFADDVVLFASPDRDLQHTLGWFAAEWQAVGMRVSTYKSEAMVLCWKTVDCSLWVGSELLNQEKEFKYLGFLFTSEGNMEFDRQIGAASAVMPLDLRSNPLLLFYSFTLHLSCDAGLWVSGQSFRRLRRDTFESIETAAAMFLLLLIMWSCGLTFI